MSYRETYQMLERMSRAFKIDSGDNAKTVQSRTASIANNTQSQSKPTKQALRTNEYVKDIQRVGSTSSTTTKKIDEVGLLRNS